MGFSVLIKASSSECNLMCRYCYYNQSSERRSIKSYGLMSIETANNIVKKTFAYTDGEVNFIFQGGEPLVRGLGFFKEFIKFVKLYNVNNSRIKYIIQTNGTLINDEWAEFFKENKFMVGVSLDGPLEIHNKMRIRKDSQGSFEDVMRGINVLKKWGLEIYIQCVVNEMSAQNCKKIFNFYKSQNFKSIQFFPYHDPINEEPGGYPYSIKPESFGKFMVQLFDLWFSEFENNNYISIRNFDNYIRIVNGQNPEVCSMLGRCIPYFSIEAGGQVYPCDLYANDNWYLGNINEINFNRLIKSEKMKLFLQESISKPVECSICEYFSLCRTGCRRNREPFSVSNSSKNYLCQGYKMLFSSISGRISNLTYDF